MTLRYSGSGSDAVGFVANRSVPVNAEDHRHPEVDRAEDHLQAAIDHAEVDPAVAAARAVPDATVARLAIYLRVLSGLRTDGVETVSSEELAVVAGVNSAKLRKDLSHLGSYGVRGVGYSVQTLIGQLGDTLGLRENRSVVLIGIGNLGQALAGYGGFASRGFRIAALIDADEARVGTRVGGHIVRHIDDLAEVVHSENISIAVIATPAEVAQQISDQLADAGVTAILNFAPTVLSVPESVNVRKVDLAAELQILSFHEQRKAISAREQGLDATRVSS